MQFKFGRLAIPRFRTGHRSRSVSAGRVGCACARQRRPSTMSMFITVRGCYSQPLPFVHGNPVRPVSCQHAKEPYVKKMAAAQETNVSRAAYFDQELLVKSSIPRDWRRILGRWVARAFVHAAGAAARREGHVWTPSQSSERPELLADEISCVPDVPLRKSHGRF